MKDSTKAEKLKYSRIWTAPRTVLKLAAGLLALLIVEFLIAEAELTVEDLLIGLPVLRHLGVDTKTLLKTRRDLLDGTDCADIKSENRPGMTGRVGRLLIARLYHVSIESVIQKISAPETDKQKIAQPLASVPTRETDIDYFEVREEEDPFYDASTLDALDIDQKEDIDADINKTFDEAVQNELPADRHDLLRQLVTSNVNVFRTSFSSGTPAKVEPLCIELTPDAKRT